jgi:SAM-dependent methyltransferase
MTTNEEAVSTTDEHVAPPEAWDAIAAGYDEFVTPGEASLANEGLRRVGLEAGERFLDIAAGPGGLSLPAARLGAKVLATDWSPAMIARFEAGVREEGLSDAEGSRHGRPRARSGTTPSMSPGRSSGPWWCRTSRWRCARWSG